MRRFEGIRYLIILDSAEIKLNFNTYNSTFNCHGQYGQ